LDLLKLFGRELFAELFTNAIFEEHKESGARPYEFTLVLGRLVRMFAGLGFVGFRRFTLACGPFLSFSWSGLSLDSYMIDIFLQRFFFELVDFFWEIIISK